MKKYKENLFAEKFQLLNSQESGAEIHWSSSDSSEYESLQNNDNFNNRKSKCKRKRKPKIPKNISNLDITILDGSKDRKDVLRKTSSDVSVSDKTEHHTAVVSPILGTCQYFPSYKCKETPISPIITSKLLDNSRKNDKSVKSPILLLKTASPIVSPKVRKKLFEAKDIKASKSNKCQAPILNSNNIIEIKDNKNKSVDLQRNCDNTYVVSKDLTLKEEIEEPNIEINYTIQETPENLDDSLVMLKTTSIDLAKKVKSYFDSHFSSENASQQSISDVPTPKNTSKSSDDVDIVSIISQPASNRGSADSLKLEHPLLDDKKEKKVRYKKDGLSYRLDILLKKQTASISLWKHERFLAANSNFVIPKEEFNAFRIGKFSFKYGCYLLNAMDCNDERFIILINCNLVSHESIFTDSVLKLYEPYKILDFKNNCKLIINVVKFECAAMKNEN